MVLVFGVGIGASAVVFGAGADACGGVYAVVGTDASSVGVGLGLGCWYVGLVSGVSVVVLC